MDPTQTSTEAAAELAAWIVAGLPWLGAALLLAVCVGVVGVWQLVRRTHDLERAARRLDALDELKSSLKRLVADREDLDLRRIEHALLEIRDGQRRVEDRLMRAVESSRSGTPATHGEPTASGLCERVTNRLLAEGFERIQIITPREELPTAESDDGVVLVEARRAGVLYKGRVQVQAGALMDAEMKPGYSAFP